MTSSQLVSTCLRCEWPSAFTTTRSRQTSRTDSPLHFSLRLAACIVLSIKQTEMTKMQKTTW
jgi:hypothetical protein